MCTVRDAADLAHSRFIAARAELLRAVAEIVSTEAWLGDGAGNLASWLAARWQISAATARELVRDAEALRVRPALQEALGCGAVSVDQCKALTALCREDTDDDAVWLDALPFWSLPELEREARKARARELERRDGGVYLRMRHTSDERFMRGEFQLPPEDGAALLGAVEARVPDGTPLREWDRASALALVELAKSSSGPAATILVSVDETVLAGDGDGPAVLGSGGYVSADTARRLACDARIQVLHKDGHGRIVGIGRTSRVVPTWLRRATLDRDHGVCTFPGCGRGRYLECHHIVAWAVGGPTELPNLLTTCWTHHELLHEGGWSVAGEPGAHVRWIRPDGSAFEPRVRVTVDTS
jgi:hypothetical protein